MSFPDIYQDITFNEESQLPLPDKWIRTMKLAVQRSDNEDELSNIIIYQDLKNGLETEEHPLITRAMNEAR